MFRKSYGEGFEADERWKGLEIPRGTATSGATAPPTCATRRTSRGWIRSPAGAGHRRRQGAGQVGDSVTTGHHISLAGSIKKDGPAGQYLIEHGVEPRDFNSYGSRRGNHEVMMRGTFANIRLRNLLAPGTEGGVTVKDGHEMSIYDAAMAYQQEGTPLVVLGGKE